MNYPPRSYRWLLPLRLLGSVYTAVILIAVTAIYVAIGTILEAKSGSHQMAAHYTFSSPFFAILLLGFFINIALAALLRWPWRGRHLPFLLAHLGLLLLLSGTLVKIYYGIQGSLALTEGSGTSTYFIPGSSVIKIDRRLAGSAEAVTESVDFTFDPTSWHGKPLVLTSQQKGWDDVTVTVIDWRPHSAEKLTSWHKDSQLSLHGLPSIPFMPASDLSTITPTKASLQGPAGPLWQIYAFSSGDAKALAQQLRNENPSLKPTALFTLDSQSQDVELVAWDDEGLTYQSTLSQAPTQGVYAYNEGFDGYRVQHPFPFPVLPHSQPEYRQARWYSLYLDLKHNMSTETPLIWPLRLLQATCQKQGHDFAAVTTAFLAAWDQCESSLCQLADMPSHLVTLLQAIEWPSNALLPIAGGDPALLLATILSYSDITPASALASFADNDPLDELHSWHAARLFKSTLLHHYPDLGSLTAQEVADFVQQLPIDDIGYQALIIAYELWRTNTPALPADLQRGLSQHLLPGGTALPTQGELALSRALAITPDDLVLQTDIQPRDEPLPSLDKWEDNRPLLTCQIRDSKDSAIITLAYDRYGTGWQWPALDNRYRLRYQPLFQPLPYRLRLHRADQINYPHSNQPLSYECQLWITPQQASHSQFVTLSMNQVWENNDGYRFYLANITPGTSGEQQHVQLVVNHDPAKYWLTYPGALILAIGIALLLYRLKK